MSLKNENILLLEGNYELNSCDLVNKLVTSSEIKENGDNFKNILHH